MNVSFSHKIHPFQKICTPQAVNFLRNKKFYRWEPFLTSPDYLLRSLQPLFFLPYSIFCKNQLLRILFFFSILLGIKSKLPEMFEKISILIVKINCFVMMVVFIVEKYPVNALIYFSIYHDPKCVCQL